MIGTKEQVQDFVSFGVSIVSCCLRRGGDDETTLERSSHDISGPGTLRQKYNLGEVLGRGTFGDVYKCTLKVDVKQTYAVKMIDRLTTSAADTEREIEMLSNLKHPSVVGLTDVYYGRLFCYIVVEYLEGGNMMDGLTTHWKWKGDIPMFQVRRLAAMTCAGVAWLHSKHCVHRDIKVDNFLMDRKAIDSPDVKIVLSDFGTVRELKAGQRLRDVCGTRMYWPPEFYWLNYSIKVDVFALGVIYYGLCNAKFPYSTEAEIQFKTPKFQDRVSEGVQRLIMAMLHKDEDQRLDAASVRDHVWLTEEHTGKDKHRQITYGGA